MIRNYSFSSNLTPSEFINKRVNDFKIGHQRENYIISLLSSKLSEYNLEFKTEGYGSGDNNFYTSDKIRNDLKDINITHPDIGIYWNGIYVCHLEISGTEKMVNNQHHLIALPKVRYSRESKLNTFFINVYNITTNPQLVIIKSKLIKVSKIVRLYSRYEYENFVVIPSDDLSIIPTNLFINSIKEYLNLLMKPYKL